jgi:hypothetical protein
MPEKLAELKRLFDLEAAKYNVFPLDDRKAERSNPDIAGRPAVVQGNTQLLFPTMRRIQENAVINTKNKSHSVTAEVEIPESGAKGVIVAQGGGMGGWTLYAHEGKLKYFYNFLGMLHSEVSATSPLPAGKHQARMEFTYDGGGIGKGAAVALYVDGKKIGEGRIKRTHARTPCSTRWTRRWRSAATWASPSRKTTPRETMRSAARSTGCRSMSMPRPRTPTT